MSYVNVLSRNAFECSITVSATNVHFLPVSLKDENSSQRLIIDINISSDVYILKISNLVSHQLSAISGRFGFYFAPISSHLCILTFALNCIGMGAWLTLLIQLREWLIILDICNPSGSLSVPECLQVMHFNILVTTDPGGERLDG